MLTLQSGGVNFVLVLSTVTKLPASQGRRILAQRSMESRLARQSYVDAGAPAPEVRPAKAKLVPVCCTACLRQAEGRDRHGGGRSLLVQREPAVVPSGAISDTALICA